MSKRQDSFKLLAKDAVEAAREALGFGLPMTTLGAESKVIVSRLAATLIQRAPHTEDED